MRKVMLVVGVLAVLASGPAIVLSADEGTIAADKTVKFHYTLTVDGNVVESSDGKDPLEYTHGQNMIIPGLENQLEGLKAGDEKKVVVSPKDGYGEVNPNAVVEVPKNLLPPDAVPQPGMMIQLPTEDGQLVRGVIKEIKEEVLMVDLNHPLAGKELTFDVKVVEVK